MKTSLSDYKSKIRMATTKEELMAISYKAFLEDDKALTGKITLYNRVVKLCIKREEELGL